LARPLLLELVQFLLSHPGSLDDPAFLRNYKRLFVTSRDLSSRLLAHPAPDLLALPLEDRAAILIASSAEKFRPHIPELESIHSRLERLAGGA